MEHETGHEALWAEMDAYFEGRLLSRDADMHRIEARNAGINLPPIAVSPLLGKYLHLMVRLSGARKVLEIGTLGGYSALWMAKALPADGKLITLEAEPECVKLACANIEAYEKAAGEKAKGLAAQIEIREGAALDTLPALEQEGAGPFDLIFIDADKPNNPHYFDWALRLSRPGTVIIADNVVRDGEVLNGESKDEAITGIRSMLDKTEADPRVSATALQTVGVKGYDGFAVMIVD